MNSAIKSRKNSRSALKRSDNKKSVSQDSVSDKKNQTKALITEYRAHHPLCKRGAQ